MKIHKRDVIVIGGGPAGASAALGLLRLGNKVTLLEQRKNCQGRVCGGFLNAVAVGHLENLNVLPQVIAADAVNVPSVTVTAPDGTRAVVPTQQGPHQGMGIPRQTLEEVLLSAVERSGGNVRWGTHVRTIEKEKDHWRVHTQNSESKTAATVVCAAGRFGLNRSIKKPFKEKNEGWFGWNGFFDNPHLRPGEMSLHFFQRGYVGLLTYANGQTNVCGLVYRRQGAHEGWESTYQEILEKQPCLARLMIGSKRLTEWRGVGPLPFARRMKEGDGLFLVGDAAAVGDPFMGEGIGRALAAGPTLCQAAQHAQDTMGILTIYAKIWQKNHVTRLWLGFLAREALKRPFMAQPILQFFLNRKRPLHHLLPLIWGRI